MISRTQPSGRPNKLGKFLRESRREAGRDRAMTLMEAAEKLGYDKNSIQAYEVGVRLPDVQFLAHAARVYKRDIRYMLSLLFRDQVVRSSDPPTADQVCIEAADQIKVVDEGRVLSPASPFAGTLNHELLAKILHAIERVENRSRKRLMPKHKARIASALYGVASVEKQGYDLGIEYLMFVISERHPDFLEGSSST